MNLSKEDYFFYEWLIIAKGMTLESFNQLTSAEIYDLKVEYVRFNAK